MRERRARVPRVLAAEHVVEHTDKVGRRDSLRGQRGRRLIFGRGGGHRVHLGIAHLERRHRLLQVEPLAVEEVAQAQLGRGRVEQRKHVVPDRALAIQLVNDGPSRLALQPESRHVALRHRQLRRDLHVVGRQLRAADGVGEDRAAVLTSG